MERLIAVQDKTKVQQTMVKECLIRARVSGMFLQKVLKNK